MSNNSEWDEQLDFVKKRFNALVDLHSEIDNSSVKVSREVLDYKSKIKSYSDSTKSAVKQLVGLVDDFHSPFLSVSSKFKLFAKNENLFHLKRRINSFDFENYIYRDELHRFYDF